MLCVCVCGSNTAFGIWVESTCDWMGFHQDLSLKKKRQQEKKSAEWFKAFKTQDLHENQEVVYLNFLLILMTEVSWFQICGLVLNLFCDLFFFFFLHWYAQCSSVLVLRFPATTALIQMNGSLWGFSRAWWRAHHLNQGLLEQGNICIPNQLFFKEKC